MSFVQPGYPKLSFSQLKDLWIQAGGSRTLAPIMAAIALAESGGYAGNTNPTDNGGTQTSWGLWQISNGTHNKPSAGNPYDPLTNAKLAVGKYKSQGLKAWGTYTSGAYEKYMSGSNSGSGGLITSQEPFPVNTLKAPLDDTQKRKINEYLSQYADPKQAHPEVFPVFLYAVDTGKTNQDPVEIYSQKQVFSDTINEFKDQNMIEVYNKTVSAGTPYWRSTQARSEYEKGIQEGYFTIHNFDAYTVEGGYPVVLSGKVLRWLFAFAKDTGSTAIKGAKNIVEAVTGLSKTIGKPLEEIGKFFAALLWIFNLDHFMKFMLYVIGFVSIAVGLGLVTMGAGKPEEIMA